MMHGLRFWPRLCSQRLQRPGRRALVGVVTLLLGWLAMDQALARIYRGLRPSLEEEYGRALGRPLKLGPYRGLRWSGLHVGPSRILPNGVDLTQLAADGLIVSVDPWASLWQRRWVVHLHAQTLQADWRRNAQGSLWTVPPDQEDVPMPVELWLHTRGPAQLRLWWQPAGVDAPPPDLTGTFVGQMALGHPQHDMVIQGRLDLASGGGLSLQSRGVPLDDRWTVQGVARGIQLDGLGALLANTPGEGLSGQVDGALTLGSSQDGACQGSLVFSNLQFPLPGTTDLTGELGGLRFDPLSLDCDGPRLRLSPGDFTMGPLAGQVQGSLGLDQHLDLQASLHGPLPPPLASLGGTVAADLRLLGPLTAPESQVHLTIADWQAPGDAAVAPQPFPTLTLQWASRWHSAEEGQQLWASLEAQAGDSQVVVSGQLTPALQLQSSTINLQPRDWLASDLWPDQPTTGSLTVAQAGGSPEVYLRLRNSQRQEDFTLQLAEDILRLNGSLELAPGQHLGLTGRAGLGQWQLEANLAVLEGALPLPLLPSPLQVVATARGRYGDIPSPASGQDNSPLQLEQARFTARLPLGLSTPDGPLLGSTQFQLRTTSQQQWTLQVDGPQLRGHGVVDWWPGRPWQEAGLDLRLALEDFSLAPLSPLDGKLTIAGALAGSLAQPRFDGELMLANPGVALLGAPQRWRGRILSLADGHALRLAAGGQDASSPAAPTLDVHVNAAFQLEDLQLRAGDGHLDVVPTAAGYRWMAQGLPLSWLRLTGVQDGRTHQVELGGALHGEGEFSLPPGQLHGDLTIDGPRWGPLQGHRLALNLRQKDHQLQLDGQLLTDPTHGQLAWAARMGQQPGTPQPWSIHGHLDGIPLQALLQSVALTRELLQSVPTTVGSSRDLGTLVIGALGEPLATQLERLAMAQERLQSLDALLEQTHGPQLRNLEGRLYGDVRIHGAAHQPVWAAVRTDLHLWLADDGVNHALAANYAPLHLHMEGPLQGAAPGVMQFSGLPLKLLNLLANLQLPWQGSLAGRGRHQDLLGQRLVSLTLDLQEGQFQDRPIQLEPANLSLKGSTVAVDLTLRTTTATPLLSAKGQVNLAGGQEALQLRFAANDELMAFLPALTDDALSWTQGDARAALIVRGSLEQPALYGYVRLDGVAGRVAGVPIHSLNSVVAFDSRSLLVEALEATVGEAGGRLSGSGYLGISQPLTTDAPLTVQLQDVDINVPNARFMASGKLVLRGSVQDPGLGGRLQLSKGVLRADGNGNTNTMAAAPGSAPPEQSLNDPLRSWDWQDPLDLVDLDEPSQLERSLLEAMAQLPPMDLQSLTVVLGPELELQASTVANFSIAGQVRLTGPVGPDLQAIGLVEFLQGWVNLFTSQFRLEPNTRNVALFTPSLGLIPYLDMAMWSQEADTRQGQGGNPASISADEITGSTTTFDRLHLVRIQAVLEGPADDFPAILRLQSKPPRSQEELVALIGGNSVNRLVQGSTGSRLFSVVGQPLLEPVLNQVSHALGQRVAFAISPTSLIPPGDSDSQPATPEFVLAGELGLNLSDRLDMAVLGALNRNDLPAQVQLSIQLTPALAAEITTERGGYVKGVLQFSSRF